MERGIRMSTFSTIACPAQPSGVKRTVIALGWFAVVVSTVAGSALACWGTRYQLFEGCWAPSTLENIGVAALRLSPAAILAFFALLAIRWPRVGGTLHALAGCGILMLLFIAFSQAGYLQDPNKPLISAALVVPMLGLVLIILGPTYAKGRPNPRWLAAVLVAGVPIATSLVSALEPAWRIWHRYDDGNMAAHRVQGNGVDLIWAPAGPGWPQSGDQQFKEAEKIAAHLTADGLSVADSPQNIWRLPKVDEVVRSLTRDGKNAGGQWDPQSGRATYRAAPDKESPLWHVRSPVIDWWTSTPDPVRPDGNVVFIVSYRGAVTKTYAIFARPTLGFRAVKERPPEKTHHDR
jgi:hypothetical protein